MTGSQEGVVLAIRKSELDQSYSISILIQRHSLVNEEVVQNLEMMKFRKIRIEEDGNLY
jgi:hypothetical protein